MSLLDTDVYICILNESPTGISQHFRQHLPGEIALCGIVKAELIYGARRSQQVESTRAFFQPPRQSAFR